MCLWPSFTFGFPTSTRVLEFLDHLCLNLFFSSQFLLYINFTLYSTFAFECWYIDYLPSNFSVRYSFFYCYAGFWLTKLLHLHGYGILFHFLFGSSLIWSILVDTWSPMHQDLLLSFLADLYSQNYRLYSMSISYFLCLLISGSNSCFCCGVSLNFYARCCS